MARWRAEALSRFPELRQAIESADNVISLWGELQSAFEHAYFAAPPDESLIGRVYAFADWSVRSAPRGPDAGHDLLTAAVAFYAEVPAFRPARDDMPRWFRYSEVAENRSCFSSEIGDEQYVELLDYMSANERRYQSRSWPE